MKYRNFGKLSWRPSALGFGAMRLPIMDKDSSKINEPEAIEMIRYAIDQGLNYIDTAYPYHQGQSELIVGKALQNGYREKIKIATKLPVWLVKKPEDFDRFLNEQLEKLQTDKIDFYLLHGLNKERWAHIHKLGVLSWSEKAIADNRIRHLGFSFHDNYDVFQKIIDAYDKWAFCQIQYNFLDVNFQAGVKGLKYAYKKGLAVVVMGPLKGGKLANPPKGINNLWQKERKYRTPVDWALQWIWNQPEVSLVLSGMSNLKQVKENIESANRSSVNSLSKEELSLIEKVREKYKELQPIPCTTCRYCLPCSQGVDIPKIFEIYNSMGVFYSKKKAKENYRLLKESQKVKNCIECGKCESLCPQNIKIIDWLKKVENALSNFID